MDKERQSRSIRQRGAFAGEDDNAKGISQEQIQWKKIEQIKHIGSNTSNDEM